MADTFFCFNCKTFFNSETAGRYYEDPSPYGITGLPQGFETYLCCPECGSFTYEDVSCDEECDDCEYAEWCGERISE